MSAVMVDTGDTTQDTGSMTHDRRWTPNDGKRHKLHYNTESCIP